MLDLSKMPAGEFVNSGDTSLHDHFISLFVIVLNK